MNRFFKNSLVLLIFVGVCGASLAQNLKYGELKSNLESKSKVESTLKSLSDLCQKQEANETKCAELGLRYSKKYDNKYFEIDFLLHLSRIKIKNNEITKSLSLAFEALELIKRILRGSASWVKEESMKT